MKIKRNKTEKNKGIKLRKNNSTCRNKTPKHYSEDRKYRNKLIE
jgi:hypothetical protein